MLTYLALIPVALFVYVIVRRVVMARRARELSVSSGWIVRHQD